MKVKDNKRIYIIFSLILVFILLFLFCVFNNKIKRVKASIFENSNEDISFTINNTNSVDNKTAEFIYNDLKTINITVDFKDVISKDKRIEIELKEGLTYKLYPVLEKKHDEMHSLINETDSLYNAISNVSYPKIDEVGYQNTNPYKYVKNPVSYGTLTYDVYENISKVTFSINVMVDWQKMYPDEIDSKTGLYNYRVIEDAISVRAYKNNEKINELSNHVEVVMGKRYTNSFKKSDHIYNETVFASTENNINYGYTNGNEFRLFDMEYNTFFAFPNYKMLEYTFYYPKGTKFKELVYANTKSKIDDCNSKDINNYCEIINIPSDDGDNKVVLKTNVFRKDFIVAIAVKYEIKKMDELKLYSGDEIVWESKEADNVKITYYDGVERTYFSNRKNSLKILHPDAFINKMNIQLGKNVYEDKNDNTYVYGPSFVITNSTAGVKNNQVLEYIIDPNYEVFGVSFPRKTGMVLKEIQYQVNNSNNWITYTGDDISGSTFSIKDAGFEIESENYFTRIKAVVESYDENYYSSISSDSSVTNAVLYGNLNSDLELKDHEGVPVTFRIYDKNDINVTDVPCEKDSNEKTIASTEVCSTKKVFYSSYKSIGSHPDILSFYSTDGQKISKISPNQTFNIKGRIIPHHYPYGTRIYMDNVNIYLRQPKGLILDTQNISLTDKTGKNVNYKVEIKENQFNEKIYILKTNKTIGYGLTKTETLDIKDINNTPGEYLDLNVNYYVNKNYDLNNIALNDLVTYGNLDYKIVARGKKDYNDLDVDGIINFINDKGEKEYDMIPDVSPETLVIEHKPEFSIMANITKDGIKYEEYNENNLDTIIEVKPNDIFEYVLDIRNNTEDSIDNYEIYIPIAKEGINYGDRFQKEAFEFDVSLLETLNLNNLYDVYYSVDKNVQNVTNHKTMNYVTNIEDKSLVTMVKIVSKKKLLEGEFYTLSLKVKVNKVSSNEEKNNINNIVYDITSSTLTGTFKSNRNAFKLYAPSISGFIFNDLNMDKKYDNKDIPVIGDISLELYKLNNNTYEKVSDINVDPKDGYFVIDDTSILNRGIYALKINVNDYNLYSDLTYDGWIKDISLLESKSYYYEIGYIKYDMDFDIEDEIIGIGTEYKISIKDLKPHYFDLIKNEESAYNWYISEEDSSYLKVNDKNSPSITIEGIKETKEDVKLCVQVVDRYNNKKEKCAKVRVKENLNPIVKAEDAHILVGTKIKYEEYLKEAIDYKDNKIKLDFNKNVKVTSDIIQENGVVTKVGVYDVTFEVADDYGNIGTTKIKIYVDPISVIITNPSTYDNIIVNIIIIVISIITVVTTGIFIYKKRYRN